MKPVPNSWHVPGTGELSVPLSFLKIQLLIKYVFTPSGCQAYAGNDIAHALKRVQTGGRETLNINAATKVKRAIAEALTWSQEGQCREEGICIGF